MFYAPKAMSAVTGWGRVFFALGQGCGPYVTGELFAIRPWAGFLGCLVVQLVEVFVITAVSDTIPLFRDQDPIAKAIPITPLNDASDENLEIELKATGSDRGNANASQRHASVRQ